MEFITLGSDNDFTGFSSEDNNGKNKIAKMGNHEITNISEEQTYTKAAALLNEKSTRLGKNGEIMKRARGGPIVWVAIKVFFVAIGSIFAGHKWIKKADAAKSLLKNPPVQLTVAIRYLSLANESRLEEMNFLKEGFQGFDMSMLTKKDGANELGSVNLRNPNGFFMEAFVDTYPKKEGMSRFDQMRQAVIDWENALKIVAGGTTFEQKSQLLALATDNVAGKVIGSKVEGKLTETEHNYLVGQVEAFGVKELGMMKSFAEAMAEKFDPEAKDFDKFSEEISRQAERFAEMLDTNGNKTQNVKEIETNLWDLLYANETFKKKFQDHEESLIAQINELRDLKQVTSKVEGTILSAIGRITDSEKGEEDFYFQMAMVPLTKELALAIANKEEKNDVIFKEYVKEKVPNAIVAIQKEAKKETGKTLSEEEALDQLYLQAKLHLNNEGGILKSYETALTYLLNKEKPSNLVAENYENRLEEAKKLEQKLEDFQELLSHAEHNGWKDHTAVNMPSEDYNSRYNLGKEALTKMFEKILGDEGEYGSPTLAFSFIQFLGGIKDAAEFLEVDEKLLQALVVDPKNGASVPVGKTSLSLNRWGEEKVYGENGDLTAREALRIKLREKASVELQKNSELVIGALKDPNSNFKNNRFTIYLDQKIQDSKEEVQIIQKMEPTSGNTINLLNFDNHSDN